MHIQEEYGTIPVKMPAEVRRGRLVPWSYLTHTPPVWVLGIKLKLSAAPVLAPS